MASPYLERRLRSYREALREIRKKHALRRAAKAGAEQRSIARGKLRVIPGGSPPAQNPALDPPQGRRG